MRRPAAPVSVVTPGLVGGRARMGGPRDPSSVMACSLSPTRLRVPVERLRAAVWSVSPTDPPPRVRCQQCGDVIGIYEPLVLLTATGRRETSLAAEPGLSGARPAVYHSTCADNRY
jgi:hypothetical protein